jgi:hemerythrin superfamily protein
MPDAIQIIQRDHRTIEQLFTRFERAQRDRDRADQRHVLRELVRELSVHAVIEEQLLYPALREAGVEEEALDALEEHHLVKLTLAELERLGPADERFAPKMRLLMENVREHVQEEEARLLPRLEAALEPSQRRELGEALALAKRAAPTRPHPAAPDTPPGNFVAGSVAALLDRSRDALRDGGDTLRAVAERGAQRGARAARSLARRAARRSGDLLEDARVRGHEVVDAAASGGREAASELRQRGRRAVDEASARADEGTRRVQDAGREAARRVQARTRAATRGYRGAPRARRGKSGGRKMRA